jgi:hypothetical protein
MKTERINTAAEAVQFLQSVDIDVINTGGGWIVRGEESDSPELTCDSEGELVRYARLLCGLNADGWSLDAGPVDQWRACPCGPGAGESRTAGAPRQSSGSRTVGDAIRARVDPGGGDLWRTRRRSNLQECLWFW